MIIGDYDPQNKSIVNNCKVHPVAIVTPSLATLEARESRRYSDAQSCHLGGQGEPGEGQGAGQPTPSSI